MVADKNVEKIMKSRKVDLTPYLSTMYLKFNDKHYKQKRYE
jgi:hypothetical protein